MGGERDTAWREEGKGRGRQRFVKGGPLFLKNAEVHTVSYWKREAVLGGGEGKCRTERGAIFSCENTNKLTTIARGVLLEGEAHQQILERVLAPMWEGEEKYGRKGLWGGSPFISHM